MSKAYIGLGSNIGDSAKVLQNAVDSLCLLPKTLVKKCSNIYKTAPVGFLNQPDFYNAVVMIETELSPNALLGALLGIEAAFGRIRTIKNGPRILDLDLLIYEDVAIDSNELTLPHPRMFERAFVMVPLCDIDSSFAEKIAYSSPDGVALTEDKLEVPNNG
jgi:2-amino-4-hydroxy-6-hydroxymethyldihydropteridine diphosphokinase